MSLPASDAFTGTNGTSLPTYSTNWSLVGSSNFIIQSNAAISNVASVVSVARWASDTPLDDQYAQGTLASIGTEPGGVACRISIDGSLNCYGAISDSNTQTEIFKYVGGSYSIIATVAFMAAGDVIRMEVAGSGLAVYKNGVQQGGTLTDSAHTSGGTGLAGAHNASNTSIDDWSSGNLTLGLAPSYNDVGTGAVSATATISPAWPTHIVDDVAFLIVETAGGEAATLSVPSGFVAVSSSPQATGATTSGTRLSLFWCRATSSSMTAPSILDSGNHTWGRIFTIRGCVATGSPINASAGSVKASASTTTTWDSVTTSIDNCLILLVASRDITGIAAAWSSPSNSSLSDLQERLDQGHIIGNGGGITLYTGIKSVAGSVGATTATVTSSVNAEITVALAPPAIDIPWVFDSWIPNYGSILAQ